MGGRIKFGPPAYLFYATEQERKTLSFLFALRPTLLSRKARDMAYEEIHRITNLIHARRRRNESQALRSNCNYHSP